MCAAALCSARKARAAAVKRKTSSYTATWPVGKKGQTKEKTFYINYNKAPTIISRNVEEVFDARADLRPQMFARSAGNRTAKEAMAPDNVDVPDWERLPTLPTPNAHPQSPTPCSPPLRARPRPIAHFTAACSNIMRAHTLSHAMVPAFTCHSIRAQVGLMCRRGQRASRLVSYRHSTPPRATLPLHTSTTPESPPLRTHIRSVRHPRHFPSTQ